MTNLSLEERFRQAAEAEGGLPVSAGARVHHVAWAVASGRSITIDLSAVPEEIRSTLVAEIKELVRRASTQPPTESLQPAPNTVKTSD